MSERKNVSLQDLPLEMARSIEKWAEHVSAEAYNLLESCADEMLADIQRTNVVKKGWKLDRLGQRKTQGRWVRRARNEEHPTLIHLFEFSYVTRFGTGRQGPDWPDPRHIKERVEARPSVLPAYYKARDKFRSGLNEIIGKG